MNNQPKKQAGSPEDSKSLNERTLEDLRKARAEIKEGKFYTLEEIKKKFKL